MARKKKENLVHFDIETLTEEVREKAPTKKASAADADISLGEFLKKTREKKRYELHTIAKKLRIKEMYLDALEKGHYYVFPGLVYGIGFLRSYAAFLGLDVKMVMDRFHQETSDLKAQPLDMPIPENRNLTPSFKTILRIILLIIIVYLIWNIVANLTAPAPREMNLQTPVVAIEKPVELPSIEWSEIPAETLAEPIVAPVVIAPKEAPKKVEAAVVVEPEPRRPVVYGLGAPAVIHVVATEETWIEVTDKNGDVVFSQTLSAGDSYNAPVDSKGMILKVSNAGGLDLFVNDKKVNPLGGKGKTATIELSKKALRAL